MGNTLQLWLSCEELIPKALHRSAWCGIQRPGGENSSTGYVRAKALRGDAVSFAEQKLMKVGSVHSYQQAPPLCENERVREKCSTRTTDHHPPNPDMHSSSLRNTAQS